MEDRARLARPASRPPNLSVVSPRLSRTLNSPAALEAYIRAAVLPRFMERLRELDDELAVHRVRLEHAYSQLAEECGRDAALFAERWRAAALAWNFDHVNELIRQHNEYYPIERNLAVDPCTGEYVTITGRPYWREPVGAAWVLEQFPPTPS